MGWPPAYICAVSCRTFPYLRSLPTTMVTLTEYWSSATWPFLPTTTTRERPQRSLSATMSTGFGAPRLSTWPIFVWPTTFYLWILRTLSLRSTLMSTVAPTPIPTPYTDTSSAAEQEDTVNREHVTLATVAETGAETLEMAPRSVTTTYSSSLGTGHSTSKVGSPYTSPPSLGTSSQRSTLDDPDIPSTADAAGPEAYPVDDFVTSTFNFAGLLAPMQPEILADELARFGVTVPDFCELTPGHASSSRRSSELDSDRSDSPTIFDVDDLSALGLSDALSWTSGESDKVSIPSCCSSAVSSVRSLYSSFDYQAIQSCAAETWSRVYPPRSSLKSFGTSIAGLKDGNASGYVEPLYVPGVESEEPVNLQHGSKTYLLRSERGRGSFGRVYTAHDYHGNLRAIKVVHKDKQYRAKDGRELLIQEKRALDIVTQMQKPFCTPLLDSWADNENVYFVMVRRWPFLTYIIR